MGAWAPVVLAPLSTWLVFRIVREHTEWRPAAWLGASLFLFALDGQSFSGGHPRAFGAPIVLGTLLLLLQRRDVGAGALAGCGVLFYPPAALVSVGMMAAAAIGLRGRRPSIDRRRMVIAGLTSIVLVALALGPLGGHGHLVSASRLRSYPEFNSDGQLPFFRDSLVTMLAGNYSGFDLRDSGSILAVATLFVFAVRPRNVRAVRCEVWALLASALLWFVAAYAVLFHLYLPNRYVRPLLAFMCIVVAVTWRPTWQAVGRRLRPRAALIGVAIAVTFAIAYTGEFLFPLGVSRCHGSFAHWLSRSGVALLGSLAAGAAITTWMVAHDDEGRRGALGVVAVVVSGALLGGTVAAAGGMRGDPGVNCARKAPKDAAPDSAVAQERHRGRRPGCDELRADRRPPPGGDIAEALPSARLRLLRCGAAADAGHGGRVLRRVCEPTRAIALRVRSRRPGRGRPPVP